MINLNHILKLSSDLKHYFFDDIKNEDSFPILSQYFSNLYTNQAIYEKLSKAIIDENTLSDNASYKLGNIRKDEQKLEGAIKEKLNSFLHSHTKIIQEPVVTIRNDRYVIPIKEEYQGTFKGFIHDVSSSGSTVFIEPITVFELNNSLNRLKAEENIEIERILEELSKLFVPYCNELVADVKNIGMLDFIFAKAKYAIKTNSIFPKINNEKKIELIEARHPLINPNYVVPINIHLGISFNTLIITGPNTGGKTVSLKTVGLLTLMSCSGLFIPANEKSSIYVFDEVFADIGDEQSIIESLSTFSSHISNIVEILNNSTSESLILLDELGSGTDPIEGSSLAISILEAFFNKKCLTLATTHYPEVKNYALVTDGFENASQRF